MLSSEQKTEVLKAANKLGEAYYNSGISLETFVFNENFIRSRDYLRAFLASVLSCEHNIKECMHELDYCLVFTNSIESLYKAQKGKIHCTNGNLFNCPEIRKVDELISSYAKNLHSAIWNLVEKTRQLKGMATLFPNYDCYVAAICILLEIEPECADYLHISIFNNAALEFGKKFMLEVAKQGV